MHLNVGEICEKSIFGQKNFWGWGAPPQIATNVWIFWAHYAVEKKQSLECKKNLGGMVPLGEGY